MCITSAATFQPPSVYPPVCFVNDMFHRDIAERASSWLNTTSDTPMAPRVYFIPDTSLADQILPYFYCVHRSVLCSSLSDAFSKVHAAPQSLYTHTHCRRPSSSLSYTQMPLPVNRTSFHTASERVRCQQQPPYARMPVFVLVEKGDRVMHSNRLAPSDFSDPSLLVLSTSSPYRHPSLWYKVVSILDALQAGGSPVSVLTTRHSCTMYGMPPQIMPHAQQPTTPSRQPAFGQSPAASQPATPTPTSKVPSAPLMTPPRAPLNTPAKSNNGTPVPRFANVPAVDYAALAQQSSGGMNAPARPAHIRSKQETDAILSASGSSHSDSCLELRIYGLPNHTTESAQKRVNKYLENLNVRDGKPLDPRDARYFPSPADNVFTRNGEPNLAGPTYHQSSIVARFSNKAMSAGLVNLENLLKLKDGLAHAGAEVYFSSVSGQGNRADKRSWGNFYFTLRSDAARALDKITDAEADSFIGKLLGSDHPTVGIFGSFNKQRLANQRLCRTIKFLHAASPSIVLNGIAASQPWTTGNYEVTFELPTGFIPVDFPTMIASVGTATQELDVIMAELFGFQDAFNDTLPFGAEPHTLLGTPERHFSDVFTIACSSLDLASFICDQRVTFGSQMELLYDLNSHGLIPLQRWKTILARQEADKSDKLEKRSEEQNEAIKMAKAELEKIREEQASHLRLMTMERQHTHDTLVQLVLSGREESKNLRQCGKLETAIATCNFNIAQLESQIVRTEEQIDDFADDPTPSAVRKHARAVERRAKLEASVAEEKEKRQNNETALTALEAESQRTIAAMNQRLGIGYSQQPSAADSSIAQIEDVPDASKRQKTAAGAIENPPANLMDLDVSTRSTTVQADLPLLSVETPLSPPVKCQSAVSMDIVLLVLISLLPSTMRRGLLCIVFLMMVPTVAASSSDRPLTLANSQLTLLALNCNALGTNWVKLADIYQLIMAHRPHVVILSETRQKPHCRPTLPSDGTHNHMTDIRREYQVHHEAQSPDNVSTGVTMLIRNGVNIAARVPTPQLPHVRGRMTAVDLTFPDLRGRLKTVRVIGIYAPTAPTSGTDTTNLRLFWDGVVSLVRSGPEDWVLGGDFNAFLHQWEAEGGGSAGYDLILGRMKKAYLDFLATAPGIDAWSNRMATQVRKDWSCRAHTNDKTKKILDRFSHSIRLTCSKIETLPVDVTATNHRPVKATVTVGAYTDSKAGRPGYQRRYLRPSGKQAAKQFEAMNAYLRAAMEEDPPPHRLLHITDSTDAFDELHTYVDRLFTAACEHAFVRPKPRPPNPAQQPSTSKEDQKLLDAKETLGRLIHAVSTNRLADLLRTVPRAGQEFDRALPDPADRTLDNATLIQRLRQARNRVIKTLSSHKQDGIARAAAANKMKQYKQAVRGGSIKYLFNPHHNIDPPFVQRRTNGSEDGDPTVSGNPAGRLDNWSHYFADLHQAKETPAANKPWMSSTAAAQAKEQTAGSKNFQWPKLISLPTLKTHLGRGNKKPSPGPDGWEKWALKNCDEDFLALTRRLMNYIIANNHFPLSLKENFITPFYKRGDVTDPRNYRGVVYANCLYSLVSSWFTHNFQRWIWKLNILPDMQIATQQGVQGGDLTSFLHQVHTAAAEVGQTIYCIKRDHTKGFDNIDPQAYLDALDFFGVNPAVAAFERARTHEVSLFVKTADGIAAQRIVTEGQTKQGDSASCIKYTLVMSMLARWLEQDGTLAPPPEIQTKLSARKEMHTPHDRLKVRLRMCEVLDDSFLFARSWLALQELIQLCEHFQTAYGIQTAWDSPEKTALFTIGADPPGGCTATYKFVIMGESRVIPFTEKPTLMRVQLNSQAATRDAILDIIDAFPIPTDSTLPLSVVRRAVKGMLMSRIRPRLALQPLSKIMATQIDQAIARKVCAAIGVKVTLTPVLSLPVKYHGFGFPSIEVINGQIAVQMLLRGLQHHIKPFRDMSAITMANWTCASNGCAPPLENPRFKQPTEGAPTQRKRGRPVAANSPPVPPTWSAAADYAAAADMPIIRTDQSDIKSSVVAHVAQRRDTQGCDKTRTRTMVDQMKSDKAERRIYHAWLKDLRERARDPAARAGTSSVAKLLQAPPTLNELVVEPSVLQTTNTRKARYTRLIQASFVLHSPSTQTATSWATDASSITIANVATRTTAAIVGPKEAMLRTTGQFSSSLHGERLGLIAALTQARNSETILTDHLNSVRDAECIRDVEYMDDTWKPRPAHELYSWMVASVKASGAAIEHVKAHTDQTDERSKLNQKADEHARRAHSSLRTVPLPPLTGWMREYSPYIPGVGYAQDNWRQSFEAALYREIFGRQKYKLRNRLNDPLFTHDKTPDHFYGRSVAYFTAKIQLMIRTGTFPTNMYDSRTTPHISPACDECGHEQQDEHHVFVVCPAFEQQRKQSLQQARSLHAVDKAIPEDEEGKRTHITAFETYTQELIYGAPASRIKSQYWKGLTPKVPPPLDQSAARMAHHLAITLASRIAGEVFRKRTARSSARLARKRTRDEMDGDGEERNPASRRKG